MSAPDTNIKRQERRHKPALRGIGLSIGVVVVLVLVMGLIASYSGIGPFDATPVPNVENPTVAN
ncbi:hypothetical protein [Chachezhania antarctica]|uniref:hypothetical protein n=1 Tax=Chachezhania antarctica TaxID=2340860 RepID=UPI000EB39048|nr:hypothetical protein [Chachezhania antarctica]|tara:strand:- start:282 stop:473 length:192 start_codon:yes stop_codon:yes gene_type:complete